MAGNRMVFGDKDGSNIFELEDSRNPNSVGRDLNTDTWTMSIHTQAQEPAGPGGLVHFRRVVVRVHHYLLTDATMQIQAFVDRDIKLSPQDPNQWFETTDADLNVTIESSDPAEKTFEIPMDAVGTSIYVRVLLDIDAGLGDIHFESIDAHGRVIRSSESRGTDE